MPPRPKKPSAKIISSNKLLDALSFLSCITKDEGAIYDTHIILHNKTATAFNSVIGAGALIDEELTAAPHNNTLVQALKKCGEGYSITQADLYRLMLKSGKFKATVPCIDPTLLQFAIPDNPVADIDNRLKEAFAVMDLVKFDPNSQRIELLSFALNGPSTITTDGKIIIEYWHGIDLPLGFAIPKAIIPVITGNSKNLFKFGFSNSSVTFYFQDGSWVKSQLYAGQWPIEAVVNILNKSCNAFAIPADFFKALDAIAPFSENGNSYFERELLCSHQMLEAGATHEVQGLPKGPIYTIKYLQMIKGLADKIDFTVPGFQGSYVAMFYGKNTRGIIAGHG